VGAWGAPVARGCPAGVVSKRWSTGCAGGSNPPVADVVTGAAVACPSVCAAADVWSSDGVSLSGSSLSESQWMWWGMGSARAPNVALVQTFQPWYLTPWYFGNLLTLMQFTCETESEIAVSTICNLTFRFTCESESEIAVSTICNLTFRFTCETDANQIRPPEPWLCSSSPPCRNVVQQYYRRQNAMRRKSLWASGSLADEGALGMGNPSLSGLMQLVVLLIGLPLPWRVDDTSTLCDLGCGLGHVLVQSAVDHRMPEQMKYYGVDLRNDRVSFCKEVWESLEPAQQTRVLFEPKDAIHVDLTGKTHVYLYDYLFPAETVEGAPPPPHP